MGIRSVNLRARLDRVRANFDAQLAETLVGRPDLSQLQIRREYGISDTVIRRVIRQFNIPARRRSPKPKAAVR